MPTPTNSARALRARGVGVGRRDRVAVRQPPGVRRGDRDRATRRVAAHDDQLAPHRRRSGLHRRRLRSDGVRRRRALRRRPRSAAAALAPRFEGEDRGRWRHPGLRALRTMCSPSTPAIALDDPRSAERCCTRRARRVGPRACAGPPRAAPSALLAPADRATTARSTCTCAPVRCTTPRRSRSRSRHPLRWACRSC